MSCAKSRDRERDVNAGKNLQGRGVRTSAELVVCAPRNKVGQEVAKWGRAWQVSPWLPPSSPGSAELPALRAGQPGSVCLSGDTGVAGSGYFSSLISDLWHSSVCHLAFSGTWLQAPSGFPMQLPWP